MRRNAIAYAPSVNQLMPFHPSKGVNTVLACNGGVHTTATWRASQPFLSLSEHMQLSPTFISTIDLLKPGYHGADVMVMEPTPFMEAVVAQGRCNSSQRDSSPTAVQ